MNHESTEIGSTESRTPELRYMLTCEASYCNLRNGRLKRAYVALCYDLYVLKATGHSREPSTFEQFCPGHCFNLDEFTASTDTEDAIDRICARNPGLSECSASRALLISKPASSPKMMPDLARKIIIIFDGAESRNRWYSAIRARKASRQERINEALNELSTRARDMGAAFSNVSSAAGGVARMAGTAGNLASALGGVAIVGPVLNGVALLLSVVDRGLKTEEGRKKLPERRSRLLGILKRLEYTKNVLLASMEPDDQNKLNQYKQMEEIMTKVLILFDECSDVMGRVERQLMKTKLEQFLTAGNLESIDEDLADLEKKLDIKHIVDLVSQCKQIEDRVKKVENRVSALENRCERDSFATNYASVPGIPNGVIPDAVPSYEELKRLLTARSPESPNRAVAIWGEGGTGKSMACVLLANDKKVKKTFSDGIQFIQLGYDFSENMVLKNVADAVENCGGREVAKCIRKLLEAGEVQEADLVQGAMRLARNWMEGKKVLIVADNVWERSIVEIVSKMAVAPESGFLFTTRILEVAEFASLNTQFHFTPFAVDTPGAGKRSATLIFDRHLGSDVNEGSPDSSIRDKLLSFVAGLPLGIASAAKLVKVCGWDDVVSELEDYLQEDYPDPKPAGNHPGLCAIMTAGLRYLDNPDKPAARNSVRITDKKFAELQSKHGMQCFRAMYLALVALPKSKPSAPAEVLQKLWGLDPALTRKVAQAMRNVSLATATFHDNDYELKLHDLQYQYCEWTCRQSGEKPAWKYRMEFLSTYLDNGQTIMDVDWVKRAFYSPQEKSMCIELGNLDSPRCKGFRLVVSLTPRDDFLALHLNEILKSITSDETCDHYVAEMASRTAESIERQYELSICDDLRKSLS